MRLWTLIKLRKTVKNSKSSEKLISSIEKEIAKNDLNHKTKDRELQDLKAIVLKSKEIVNSETPKEIINEES